MAYNFHYTPTGTGVISGKEVLEQTEDAINDLGNTAISGVQEAIDKAEQALTNSQNAVDDAQTALNTANNADENATTALNTVNSLSSTVTNIGNRVTTAEGNITNLQGRMTTAEGNVTNLQGRMTTAEGNIGNLQTAVSTAQASANSAQQTANTARQQAYVLRYASSAVTPNSTVAYSVLNNTDNVKVGDSLIDASGQVFLIVSVDSANQTVTVGAVLLTLAPDANVVHVTGNETIAGVKDFTDNTIAKKIVSNVAQLEVNARSNADSVAVIAGASYADGGSVSVYGKNSTNGSACRMQIYNTSQSRYERIDLINSQFLPTPSGELDCGGTSNKWKTFNGINPGALSFPDLSAGLDISAYISVTNGQNILSTYTAPADGWISINLGRSSGSIGLIISNGSYSISGRDNTFPDTHRECPAILPVFKNDTVSILSNLADSVLWAYFYPCNGNV